MTEVIEGAVVRTSDKLCSYVLGDGAKCLKDHYCRGYCEAHYRQLKRAGAFADTLKKKPASDIATLAANVASVRRARKKLLKHAPDFVDHLVTASRNAAMQGKSDPAQWALLHAHVVTPVNVKGGSETSTPATVINVGVKVSGVDSKRE